jgi:hypothetical protein
MSIATFCGSGCSHRRLKDEKMAGKVLYQLANVSVGISPPAR